MYRGWDLRGVLGLCYTSMYYIHWLAALSSRRSSDTSNTSSSIKLLRWLFVDHVCVVLHVLRNVLLLVLATLKGNAGGSDTNHGILVLATCYGALAALNEPYELATSLVVSWAVLLPRAVMQVALLSRGEEPSLVAIVVFPLLHACTQAAIRIAAARCRTARVQLLQFLLARVQTLWTARIIPPADHAAEASVGSQTGTPLVSAPASTAAPHALASAMTPAPATASTEAITGFATPAAGSVHSAVGDGGLPRYRSAVAGNASVVNFVTKFPSVHLTEHPQLSTPEGVAALRERLERRASEVLSRIRGELVEVRLLQFYIAAGCVVVSGRWEVHGFVGGMSDQEMRALVEDVMVEEMVAEMLQEVDRTPEGMCTPRCILDSTSELRQLTADDDAESQAATMLHVETGRRTPLALSPSTTGVPLLAATTPLQAMPMHGGGNNCVHVQFATPLPAHAFGRDSQLVVSFSPAEGASAPAPHAALFRASICDLQAAAHARGNPPGLMDIKINLGFAHAGAAREYGGMLIAQLVDGPTMLAAVPVPLLPCAARPAVAELSRLGLDPRNALHVACDLGLLVLAPHPTGQPSLARRGPMLVVALQLKQWAQKVQDHLPAALALLDSAMAKLDAADASPLRPLLPAPRPGILPAAVVAAQGGADGAPADRESARCAFEDGLGHALLGGAAPCFTPALPFIMILVIRARPALLARLPR
ncbi:hypothetical protein FOA52_013493 [Chlamydomonas sp. UWO 241]|nr:hypothetical protein FOA52_013493 [Chlamydomonas sp. UWO 241]